MNQASRRFPWIRLAVALALGLPSLAISVGLALLSMNEPASDFILIVNDVAPTPVNTDVTVAAVGTVLASLFGAVTLLCLFGLGKQLRLWRRG